MQNNMPWHTKSPVNWNQSDSGMKQFFKLMIALASSKLKSANVSDVFLVLSPSLVFCTGLVDLARPAQNA